MDGLIGYTGFVGSTLLTQRSFDKLYNSKNITTITGESFDLLICAGAPAVKWKANQEPDADLANLKHLMDALSTVKAKKFVLISTVDVYPSPANVDEDTVIDPEANSAYGKHRYYLEQFVRTQFPEALIVRLPGLFGEGLKKNFIYDLIHTNCLHLTHKESQFQFYDMSRLWMDLLIAQKAGLKLINFSPEPVIAHEVAAVSFGLAFETITDKEPVIYDMKSKFSSLYLPLGNYMYSKDQIYNQIRHYADSQKGAL